jgi:secondary thiamine-phosphate synthase enzyme
MVVSKTLEVYPGPGFAVLNITQPIANFVASTHVQQGQLIIFYKHTTGSVIIGEHEGGIVADLEEILESIAPTEGVYHHHLREVDFNGFAHIRAAIMPTSIVIPIQDGEVVLGTHQEIMVIDNQPEELARYVYLQVAGE